MHTTFVRLHPLYNFLNSPLIIIVRYYIYVIKATTSAVQVHLLHVYIVFMTIVAGMAAVIVVPVLLLLLSVIVIIVINEQGPNTTSKFIVTHLLGVLL